MDAKQERQRVLVRLSEKQLLIEPKALEALLASGEALELIDDVARNSKGASITAAEVQEVVESRRLAQQVRRVEVRGVTGFNPPARDVASQVELNINNTNVSAKASCVGTVDDFVKHFRNRYQRQRETLRGIRSKAGATYSLNDAKKSLKNKDFRVIVMVYDKKVTKNGHLLLEVEDEETSSNCLVPKDSPLFEEAARIIQDEVLALDVFNSASSLLIVKDIVRPGQLLQERRKKLIDEDIYTAFISDIHVGSKFFMQENFEKFLAFLNGKGTDEEKEIAGKIKYISIAGDNVDGIGVYPGQEKQLVTKDIYLQYEILCEYLKQIPEHIEVIMIPGNHDAVRIAEPQPALPQDFTHHVKGYKNIHFAPSPSMHSIHGLSLLAYHGTSTDGIIAHAPSLRQGYERPELVGVSMLERRHMLPLYGEDALVPEERDQMLIEQAPDMFHMGHVHKTGYLENYNGTLIMNAGTWQARTDFQVRMGHNPTPCLLPVYNMKTGKVKVLNFNE